MDKSVLLPDQQELWKIGDRVIRPTDLSRTFFKKGVVVGVSATKSSSGVSGTHWYSYTILWDGDSTPDQNYMGSCLEREP